MDCKMATALFEKRWHSMMKHSQEGYIQKGLKATQCQTKQANNPCQHATHGQHNSNSCCSNYSLVEVGWWHRLYS